MLTWRGLGARRAEQREGYWVCGVDIKPHS